MKTLQIRFVKTSGFVGRAIAWVTRSRLSHVEFILENGTTLGAHAKDGVQIRPLNMNNVTLELIYNLELLDEVHDLIIGFAKSKIGCKYDYQGCFGILFHDLDEHGDGTEDCSMLVLDACAAGNLFLLNVNPKFSHLITPELLHLSAHFRGKLAITPRLK